MTVEDYRDLLDKIPVLYVPCKQEMQKAITWIHFNDLAESKIENRLKTYSVSYIGEIMPNNKVTCNLQLKITYKSQQLRFFARALTK